MRPCMMSPDELLRAAASAELRSKHLLGRAVVAHARTHGIFPAEAKRFPYTPGQGISATIEGAEVVVGSLRLMREHGIRLRREVRASPTGLPRRFWWLAADSFSGKSRSRIQCVPTSAPSRR